MTTKVEKSIQVEVPVSTAYNQWTQFEEFPQFMGGVQQVEQLTDQRLRWTAEIAGVKRQWEASILEQVPDQKIAWAATEGATNAGAVYFTPIGGTSTLVRLELEYEPEGIVEQVGDKLNVVGKRAEADLEKFKQYIESKGSESGAWRGSVNEGGMVGTPGAEAAASTQGDSGKAGLSAKTVVAGAAAAAAGVAAASAMRSGSGESVQQVSSTEDVTVAPGTTYVAGSETGTGDATTGDVTDSTTVDVTEPASGVAVEGGDSVIDPAYDGPDRRP
ncbi:MAG: SRPBCC family protein [Actinomycetota bacterium]|nr:SRPBCC family protein [Actinomycetota bacterium]